MPFIFVSICEQIFFRLPPSWIHGLANAVASRNESAKTATENFIVFFPFARWKPNAGIVRIDARLYRLLGEDEKIMTCGRMCTQALRS